MKKIIILAILGLNFTSVKSQDISDAMRYAVPNLNGTARYSAMSGAFGALGGDLSALNNNPAGSAVFNNSQFAFTMNNCSIKNKSTYFGTPSSSSNSAFDINQAGAVFVFENQDSKSDWKKISVGVNYENTTNFDNSFYSAGTNPNHSIDSYFLYFANKDGGISESNLQLQSGESITDLYSYLGSKFGYGAQQAFLGYKGHLIASASDYNEMTNRKYISLVPDGGNYYQENNVESSGYNGKVTFNAATQYKDKFYFGANLNIHFTDYIQNTRFYESNTNNLTDGIQRLQFENGLHTFGSGFSFQLGAIAKLTKEFRVGLSYESPTWYELNDQLTQGFTSVSADALGVLLTEPIYPNTINTYPPYQLQTPGKWIGSFSYIFGKSGLLSIDYALKDYSNTTYKPKADFTNNNTYFANQLQLTSEVRIGGEYRIKAWSLRGGYRFEQSPYKTEKALGNLNGFSTGLGYNFGASHIDLAYSHTQRDSQNALFSVGLTDSAQTTSRTNTIALTLVFEL
jgi:hypothetical protein